MTTSQLIARTLTAAAAASPKPIKPEALLDRVECLRRGYLGCRLQALVIYRLHTHHSLSLTVLSKALRLPWQTAYDRNNTGALLRDKSPWRETYLSLP
jgi:hypothetical protein